MATASTSIGTGHEDAPIPTTSGLDEQGLKVPLQLSELKDRLSASESSVDASKEVLDNVVNCISMKVRTRSFINHVLGNIELAEPEPLSDLMQLFSELATSGGIPSGQHLPLFASYLGFFLLKGFFEEYSLWMTQSQTSLSLDMIRYKIPKKKVDLYLQEALKEVESQVENSVAIDDVAGKKASMRALLEPPTLESLGCISSLEDWNSSLQAPYSKKQELKAQPMLVLVGNLIDSHQWFVKGSPNEGMSSILELILLNSKSSREQNLLLAFIRKACSGHGSIIKVNNLSKKILKDFKATKDSNLITLITQEMVRLSSQQSSGSSVPPQAAGIPTSTTISQQPDSRLEMIPEIGSTSKPRSEPLQSTEKKPTLQAGISASPSPLTQPSSLLPRKGDLDQVQEGTVDSPSLKRLRNASQPNLHRGSESNDPSFPTSSTIPGGLNLQADTTSNSMDQDQDVSNVSSNQSIKPFRKRAATMSQVGNQIETEASTPESNQQRSASISGVQGQASSTPDLQLSQTHQQSTQSASQSSKDQPEQQKKLNASVLQLGLPSEIESEKRTVKEVEDSIHLLKASILKLAALSTTDAIQHLQKVVSELQILKSVLEKQLQQSSAAAAAAAALLQLSEPLSEPSVDNAEVNKKRKNKKKKAKGKGTEKDIQDLQKSQGGQAKVGNDVKVESGKAIRTVGENGLLWAVSLAIKDFELEQPISDPSFGPDQVEPQQLESTTSSTSLVNLANVSSLLRIKDVEPAEAQRNHSNDLASLQDILSVAISGFVSFENGKSESSLESLSSFSSSQLLKKGTEVIKSRNRGNRPIAAEFNSTLLASSSTSILESALETYMSTLPADAAEGLRGLMEVEIQEKDSNDVQDFYKQISAQLKEWIKRSASVRNLVPASKLLVDIIVDHSALKASLLLPISTLTALNLDTRSAHAKRFDSDFESKMREVRETLFKSFLKLQEGSSNLQSQQRLS